MVRNFFSERPHCGLVLEGIGAQQHFKAECDLNVIIKKYPDGVPPPPATRPVYGDFTALGKGLQDSMNALQYVSDWFASLPSEVRARFDNDPLAAQRFVLDNPDEAIKLGILSASKPAPQARAEGPADGAQAAKDVAAVAVQSQAAPAASPEGAAS